MAHSIVSLLPLAARTTAQNLGPFDNATARGLALMVNITAITPGDTLAFDLHAVDPYNNTSISLFTVNFTDPADIHWRVIVYPGASGTADLDYPLPAKWSLLITPPGHPVTYSVVAHLLE